MLPSPKQDAGWHSLVCCDSNHGSSSMAAMAGALATANAGDGDVVMADLMSSASSAPSSAPPSTASAAPSVASAPPPKCASPCPFETYCCLDEHCAADCIKAKAKSGKPISAHSTMAPTPACNDADCAEACFDPSCDDGCEAECCDDPECEPEWCVQGCTIEEYLECCASVCNEPDGNPLGLNLPHPETNGNANANTSPAYFDLISAALAGQLAAIPMQQLQQMQQQQEQPAAPLPAPTLAPPAGANVCHWQNCHRTFESMPQLLAHLAADHLGAGMFDAGSGAAASSSAQATPAAQPTPASHPMSVVATPQTPLMGMGFENTMHAAPASSAAPPASASQGDLLSCLWDDCFPLDSLGSVLGTNGQGAPQMQPNVNAHALHSHLHTHMHPHSHAHSETSAPLSPQTMLRHLLEEHLGVVPALVDPASTSISSQQQVTHEHGHGHDHAHPVHATHDHMHVHDGHEHPHPHGHAHNHPHSHRPRPKPYARPASSVRNTPASAPEHEHSPSHPHVHSHDHSHNHDLPHAHHHHVKFPPSPSPTPSGELPALVCLWPGCTHSEPFATTGDLMEHLSEEHVGRGRDKYRCLWDGCGGPEGRLFRSRQKVLRHLQSHTGHRPFVCHVCGQSFSEAAPLAAHLRRHSDDKPYVCDFPGCGKAFAISSSLTIHKRTHNGDKPFVCSYCGKGFVEASNLTKHVRTHTGERPFACAHPGCGRAFSRPDQLKRHMLVHEAGRRKNKCGGVKNEEVAATA